MSDKDPFAELRAFPERCASPIRMIVANEVIPIYAGVFVLKNDEEHYQLNGAIEFKWFPYMSVSFYGTAEDQTQIDIRLLNRYDVYVNDIKLGNLKLTGIDFTANRQLFGSGSDFGWGERNIAVDKIGFALPNFRDYLGECVKDINEDGALHVSKTRLKFEDDSFTIVMDKLIDYKERKEQLSDARGYLILWAGEITSKKASILLKDFQQWRNRFEYFLYFLNGLRTAPLFLSGFYEGKLLWTDYTPSHIDSYQYTKSWSDIFFLNDLPDLWLNFNNYWKDESDRDFLVSVIHWYLEANMNSSRIEGSIILIQTALELIYNWLIVEKQKQLIGKDGEGLSAANKIRMLVFQLKIGLSIPSAFIELAKIPDVQDAPEALVKIRNALVHGQENKRKELASISLQAKYEALQLGIWYTELSLLFILNYKGNYNNRTNGNNWRNSGELVPWINQIT